MKKRNLRQSRFSWLPCLFLFIMSFYPLVSGQTVAAQGSESEQYRRVLRAIARKDYAEALAEGRRLIERTDKYEQVFAKLVQAAKTAGQLEKAQALFNALLQLAPPNPRGYYGLGLIAHERGDYAAAIEYQQRCLKEQPEFPAAMLALVDAYRKAKKLEEAETYLKSLVETRPNSPVAHLGMGYCYAQSDRTELAVKEFDIALFQNEKMPEACYCKSHAYTMSGQFAVSIVAAKKCLLPMQAGINEEHEQAFLNLIGTDSLYLKNYSEAVSVFNQAFRLAQELEDKGYEEVSLIYLALASELRGTYTQALAIYQKALGVAQNSDSPFSLVNRIRYPWLIGKIYYALGDLSAALQHFQQALDQAEKADDEDMQATALAHIGDVFIAWNDAERAVAYYNRVLSIEGRRANPRYQLFLQDMLSTLYLKIGAYQKAQTAIQQALTLAHAMPDYEREMKGLNNSGELALRLREPERALTAYRAARQLALDKISPRHAWQACAGLAAAYRELQQFDAARSAYQEAIEIIERVRANLGGEVERAGFFQDKVKVYQELLGVLLQLHDRAPEVGHDAAAFHIAERGRGRAFADLLTESQLTLEEGLGVELAQQQKALQQRLSELNAELLKEKALAPEKQSQAVLTRLEAEFGKVDAGIADWLRKVRADNPRYAELRYPEPVRLEQAQRLLDAQTLLLAYTLGAQESYLFAVTQKGLRVLRLPGAARLNGLVERLLAALTNRGETTEDHRPLAGELYRDLIAPVDRAGLLAKKTRLIVVADGALHRLPFEVLLPGGKRPYLVERLAISYAPSASVLVNLKNAPRPAESGQKPFVAFAAPQYDSRAVEQADSVLSAVTRAAGVGQRWNFAPLRFSDREAHEIAKLFGKEALVFTGAQANEENVKVKDRLQQYRLVHFSAHGLVNEQRPRFSSLVLSLRPSVAGPVAGANAANKPAVGEDGLLSAYEIFSLKLKADLVTLSACETALGKEVKGEGLMSLVRAFMYAGTPSVLASLWKVDDEGTAKLMVEFYRNLTQGTLKNGKRHTKAEALQRAQVDAIKRGRAPYYWAPFVLIGKAD